MKGISSKTAVDQLDVGDVVRIQLQTGDPFTATITEIKPYGSMEVERIHFGDCVPVRLYLTGVEIDNGCITHILVPVLYEQPRKPA